MADMSGGCLCGRVRYTATGEPIHRVLCHCRNCQRWTGSTFQAVMAFPAASVTLQGELKTFEHIGGSGQAVHRRFCPNCGSGVVDLTAARPDLIMVLVGTLDDPAAFVPTVEIFCDSAQPWVHAGGERERFPGRP